ncbi:MAG: discoidin domain-containing protein [Polyangiaceae bacterium]
MVGSGKYQRVRATIAVGFAALAGLQMFSGCAVDTREGEPSAGEPEENVGSTEQALVCPAPTPIGVTASAGAIQGAAGAIDGNLGTRWESAWADNQVITIDIGVITYLSGVTLNWEAACGRDYYIDVSQSGTGSWYRLATVTGNTTSGVVTHLGSAKGRYVRLTGQTRCTQYGFSLWEFSANIASKKCYVDFDGDGYGASGSFTETCAATCPAGRSSSSSDCDDVDARVKPNQSTYFQTPRSNGSYDYSCNGVEEKQVITGLSGCAAGAVYPNCTSVNGPRPTSACGTSVLLQPCAAIPKTPVWEAHCGVVQVSGPNQPCR